MTAHIKNPALPVVAVSVGPELKARIIAVAEADGRSMSNWVLTAIREKLDRDAR